MPAFGSKILFILLEGVGLEGLKLSLFLVTNEMSLGILNYFRKMLEMFLNKTH
jgi:hypothetical protein